MKICFTSLGGGIDSPIDPRFGRARYFIILDEKGNVDKVIPNEGSESQRGAGILAAQTIASEKVNALVSGNVGPNAFNLLSSSGIEMFSASAGSVKENFLAWKENRLPKIASASPAGFGGRGGGMGRGRGMGGRGRNWQF